MDGSNFINARFSSGMRKWDISKIQASFQIFFGKKLTGASTFQVFNEDAIAHPLLRPEIEKDSGYVSA